MKFLIVMCIILVSIGQSYCGRNSRYAVVPVATAENEDCPINENRRAVINSLYNTVGGSNDVDFCSGYTNAIVAAQACANELLASKGGVRQGNEYDEIINAAKTALGNNTTNLRIKAIFQALKEELQRGDQSLPTNVEY